MKPEMVRVAAVLVLLAIILIVMIALTSIPLAHAKLETTQLLIASVNILVVIMCWNLVVMSQQLEEVRKDRRLGFLKERIEKFYTPLIRLFGHGTLHRGPKEHQEVEEIIVSRRHLCGRKLASILPPHFTAMTGTGSFYFSFTEEEEKMGKDRR